MTDTITIPTVTESEASNADVESPVMNVQAQSSTQPYNVAVDILDKAFTYFNEKLFGNCIETQPIITIQSKGRKNACGWFWASKWKNGKENRCEINISAEELARSASAIFETLIHEMVHQYNWQRTISDCSANQYHNKRFKAACEEVGLKCEKLQNYGWASTSLGEKALEVVNNFIADNDCKVFSTFKRVEKRREYRQVWTVPVSRDDKEWIEIRSIRMGISQKELIAEMIRQMPAIDAVEEENEAVEEPAEEKIEAVEEPAEKTHPKAKNSTKKK